MAGIFAESDLVRDSKLETTFSHGYTIHIINVAGETRRRSKRQERWKREERLGEGTFGTVWKESLVADGEPQYRAVKKVRKHQDYVRELDAIIKFSHQRYSQCFVKSFGWYERDDDMFIAMEYLPLGCLQRYLSSHLSEDDTQEITWQILEGLSYMHENGFTHRDLKPTNILVKSEAPDWWVKIADFGSSKRAERDDAMTSLQTMCGTPGFVPPEAFVQDGIIHHPSLEFHREHKAAGDMWSLGVIVYNALTGTTLFPCKRWDYIVALKEYIQDVKSDPFPSLRGIISQDAHDFIRGLLAPLPQDRLTTKNALSHAWMAPKRSTTDEFPDLSTLAITDNGTLGPPLTAASATWPSQTLPRAVIDASQAHMNSPLPAQSSQATRTLSQVQEDETDEDDIRTVGHANIFSTVKPTRQSNLHQPQDPRSKRFNPENRPNSQHGATPAIQESKRFGLSRMFVDILKPAFNKSTTPQKKPPQSQPAKGQDYKTPKIPYLPDDEQPIIIQNDFNDPKMLEQAFLTAHEAMEQWKRQTDIAWHLKRKFDSSYGKTWYCFVGSSFGTYVTFRVTFGNRYFIIFKLQDLQVILYKTTE